MSFLDSINQGLEKANEADAAKNEVTAVFAEVNSELSNFTPANLKLERNMSTAAAMLTIANMSKILEPKEYFNEDSLCVHVSPRDGRASRSINVAKWSQNVKGYPCVISFEGSDYICTSADDLRSGLKELFASVSFGKQINAALK